MDDKLTHLFAAQHHFRQFGGVNSALAIIFLANYGISFDVRPKHVVAGERKVSCDMHKWNHSLQRQFDAIQTAMSVVGKNPAGE